METVKLSVEGMHCEGCVSRVKSALSDVVGVDSVQVSLEENEATVAAADPADSTALVSAVERAGYSATVRS